MVRLLDIEAGETYRFVIDQSGTEYEAVVEMDTSIGSVTGTAVGMVESSTYPTGGWEGKQLRFHEDGTVDRSGDPFGDIGVVVSVEEV